MGVVGRLAVAYPTVPQNESEDHGRFQTTL